jgi:hypothetical protein
MSIFKALKRTVLAAVLSTGIAVAGCGSDSVSDAGDTSHGGGDGGYGPPSCSTDEDCLNNPIYVNWFNHCNPIGYCEHVDKDAGVQD